MTLHRKATEPNFDGEDPDACSNVREYLLTNGQDQNIAVREHLQNCMSCEQWLADRRTTGTSE